MQPVTIFNLTTLGALEASSLDFERDKRNLLCVD